MKNLLIILFALTSINSLHLSANAAMKGEVRIDGSSTVFPISEAVAEEFLKVQPRVRVTVGVSGTGGGFKKFLNGEIDINDASRPIKAQELKISKEKKVEFLEIPVAYDGLSVVVNKKNDWIDFLTTDELKKIWKPGSKVEKWSQVRTGWPDIKIRLYGPGTDSGTFDYFTETIMGKSQASRADFTKSEDDNVLVQGVAGDKGSLGYFGFAYYKENKDKVKAVPIKTSKMAKSIMPTMETINNGTYTPLSRPVFIYVRKAALKKAQVSEFVQFYINEAGKLSKEVGYVPLEKALYAKSLSQVKSVK